MTCPVPFHLTYTNPVWGFQHFRTAEKKVALLEQDPTLLWLKSFLGMSKLRLSNRKGTPTFLDRLGCPEEALHSSLLTGSLYVLATHAIQEAPTLAD